MNQCRIEATYRALPDTEPVEEPVVEEATPEPEPVEVVGEILPTDRVVVNDQGNIEIVEEATPEEAMNFLPI
jgi:hypothetical protein